MIIATKMMIINIVIVMIHADNQNAVLNSLIIHCALQTELDMEKILNNYSHYKGYMRKSSIW